MTQEYDYGSTSPNVLSVRGNDLPQSYVQAATDGRLAAAFGKQSELDAYGNKVYMWFEPLEAHLDALMAATLDLEAHYILESGDYAWRPPDSVAPGLIPMISDYSKIVCFGEGGDGGPICFDFRDDKCQPSIIWWADAYWLRVAPDFESLVALFFD